MSGMVKSISLIIYLVVDSLHNGRITYKRFYIQSFNSVNDTMWLNFLIVIKRFGNVYFFVVQKTGERKDAVID